MDRTEVAIRAAQVGDLPGIQTVAETAWAVAYRGIILEEIQRRLLEAGLAELGRQGVRRLTVQVERDNAAGRRFYRSRGFAEVREFSQEVQGYSLQLVECRRDVDGPVQRPA